MYAYLRSHPGLFLPERKELRYFGADLDIRNRVALTEDEYLAHFRDAPVEALVGTGYVWYLYSRTAAREIHDFNPNARIIVMLRDPVSMLHALHSEHLSNGNEDIEDFELALAAELDRRAGRRIPRQAHLPQGLLYSEVPRYAEQLERYFDAFGREQVHVILFDDFVAAVEEAYRGTLRFLGVPDGHRPASFEVVNPNRKIRSQRLRAVLSQPPELPRRVIRRLVPARLRRAAFARVKELNVQVAPRPPLDPDVARRLQEAFADEVVRLERLLGRDLSVWKQPVASAGVDGTLA